MLRAVARLGGYFLIDIEMIYVCCLMSSHTQTQADRRMERRTDRPTDRGTAGLKFSFHATPFWTPLLSIRRQLVAINL